MSATPSHPGHPIPGDHLQVLLVQATLGWKQPAENRAHLEDLLEQAQSPFDLAVFPETFTTGFLGDPDVPNEGMDGPTLEWMRELAVRHQGSLAGSAVIVEDGKRFNRFLLVTPAGDVHTYDKRHLFSYGGENKRYAPGSQRVTVPLGPWRTSLQVCYDLRFPAWCRHRGDFDLQIFVANWPASRVEHWQALLRARAIENQAWVIGLNRAGEDGNGIAYPGCSLIFDPLGETVCELGAEEETRLVSLDRSQVEAVRGKFPFQADADPFTLQT
ncbi:nitrilase-related carbon-nitrogen hydrolase [Elongatibacter sediminis]|uniref:Omega-amidase YafV n=1 Tax=Elongatibacter sediminis TaxID=3119006 RepID=A0AAW9RKN2_9GAMM